MLSVKTCGARIFSANLSELILLIVMGCFFVFTKQMAFGRTLPILISVLTLADLANNPVSGDSDGNTILTLVLLLCHQVNNFY